jgi:hypothetical protein
MASTSAAPDRLPLVRQELLKLRQGPALAHPTAVLRLSNDLRRLLARPADAATETVQIVAALVSAIENLDQHHRQYARVDFNLDDEHSYPTLTERQESLAQQLKCAAKTVRRHADRALETIAVRLLTSEGMTRAVNDAQASKHDGLVRWQHEVARFWHLSGDTSVDIVCSEIPDEERPDFASPIDRNYLRYAKFADLDSLVYTRTRLVQALPNVSIRDFSPSEYYGGEADTLVIIGGPPWNAKFREFLPQLPFHFEPHPLGEDDPLVVPCLDDRRLGPSWTVESALLSDVAVFVRLTLLQGTTVFLLGGCLTLGVLGAAKCFLHEGRGAANVRYVTDLVGERDFVLVSETARVGGITDVADLTRAAPLLLLARAAGGHFDVLVDNTERRPYP